MVVVKFELLPKAVASVSSMAETLDTTAVAFPDVFTALTMNLALGQGAVQGVAPSCEQAVVLSI